MVITLSGSPLLYATAVTSIDCVRLLCAFYTHTRFVHVFHAPGLHQFICTVSFFKNLLFYLANCNNKTSCNVQWHQEAGNLVLNYILPSSLPLLTLYPVCHGDAKLISEFATLFFWVVPFFLHFFQLVWNIFRWDFSIVSSYRISILWVNLWVFFFFLRGKKIFLASRRDLICIFILEHLYSPWNVLMLRWRNRSTFQDSWPPAFDLDASF